MRTFYKFVMCLVLSEIVTGCTSLADKSAINERAELNAVNAEVNVQTLLPILENAMANQREALMPFYAPLHWKLARESFDEAVSLVSKNSPEIEIKKRLLIVQDCIEAMPGSKQTALKELDDVAEYFRFLRKIEADNAYPEEYAELIEDLRDITKKIDAPDLDAAREAKQSLLKDMTRLEIKTITFQQTSLAETTLEVAEDADADDLAEKSYKNAEKSLDIAKKLIAENPRNKENIATVSSHAFIEASHAGAIAREVKSIVEKMDDDAIEEESLEGLVLRFETSLVSVARGFGLPDLRYLSLSDQASLLADYASLLTAGERKKITVPPHANGNYPPVSVDSAKLWLPPDF